jgi:hypothetical protein
VSTTAKHPPLAPAPAPRPPAARADRCSGPQRPAGRPCHLASARAFARRLSPPAPRRRAGASALPHSNGAPRRTAAITRSWWNAWLAYVQPNPQPGDAGGADAPAAHPGEIQNALLLAKQPDSADADLLELREDLQPERDLVILSEPAWRFLHRKYGGGPEIRRGVTKVTLPGGEQRSRVCLYPLRLQVGGAAGLLQLKLRQRLGLRMRMRMRLGLGLLRLLLLAGWGRPGSRAALACRQAHPVRCRPGCCPAASA